MGFKSNHTINFAWKTFWTRDATWISLSSKILEFDVFSTRWDLNPTTVLILLEKRFSLEIRGKYVCRWKTLIRTVFDTNIISVFSHPLLTHIFFPSTLCPCLWIQHSNISTCRYSSARSPLILSLKSIFMLSSLSYPIQVSMEFELTEHHRLPPQSHFHRITCSQILTSQSLGTSRTLKFSEDFITITRKTSVIPA